MTICPCQNTDYDICCKPFHTGERYAPTALDLMRSRYSAYALAQADYLISTTHRDNPQYQNNIKAWRDDITVYCNDTEFLGLKIIEDTPGKETAAVTFEASLSRNGTPFTLREKSYFVKIGQRWLYHSGLTDTTPCN